jgi:hypothetical protein
MNAITDQAIVDPEAWERHLLSLAAAVRPDRVEVIASSLLECVLWMLEEHERAARVPEPAAGTVRAALWSPERERWEAAHRVAAPALEALVEVPALPDEPILVARVLASRAVLEAFLAAPLPPDGEPVSDVSLLAEAFVDVADLTEIATDHLILPRAPEEVVDPAEDDLDHHPITIAHRRVQEGLFHIAADVGLERDAACERATEASRLWARALREHHAATR